MIESGAQLFSRVQKSSHLEGLYEELFSETGPGLNQTVEITGEPTTGKTILFLECLVRCILPESCSGKNSHAIFINTDHKCNMFNINEIIKHYLIRHNQKYTQQQIKDITNDCLKRLTILNCYNSNQLKMTITNVENIVWKNQNITLVAVDSISTFYWCDRNESDMTSLNSYNTKIITLLNNLISDCGLVGLYTKATNDTQKELKKCNSDYKIILLKHLGDVFKSVIVEKNCGEKTLYYSVRKTFEWIKK